MDLLELVDGQWTNHPPRYESHGWFLCLPAISVTKASACVFVLASNFNCNCIKQTVNFSNSSSVDGDANNNNHDYDDDDVVVCDEFLSTAYL